LAFVNLQLEGNSQIDLKFKESAVYWRVRKIAKSDYKLRYVCVSIRPSAWNNSDPTGQIFMKSNI